MTARRLAVALVLAALCAAGAFADRVGRDSRLIARTHAACRRAQAIAAELDGPRAARRVHRGVEDALGLLAEAQRALPFRPPGEVRDLLARASRRALRARRLADKLLAKQQGGGERWSVALDGLGGALLSVWATPGNAPDVYAVGADDGQGPVFLRGTEEAFVRIPVAASDDLWWVTGVPAGSGATPTGPQTVWSCGTGGRVVRYDPATGAVTDLSTGVDATLYGVWGSGPDDVWTVGGDPQGAGPRPALLRWDGASWASVVAPPEADGKILYKVWGTAADDVWACGQGGLLLRFDGISWASVASGTASTLLTVHGDAAQGTVVAVGGPGVAAVVVERGAAGAWSPASLPPGTESLNGVFVPATGAGPGDAWAVGYFGEVLRRAPGPSGRWAPVAGVPATRGEHHHAVHVDDTGAVWVAGGDLFTMGDGSLLRYGEGPVPTEVLRRARLRDDVQPVIYASCAFTACHVKPFLSEDLDLETAEATYAGLAGVPSRQSPLLRVAPGRPSASYLWHKLRGTHASVGGGGDRMPQGDPPLSTAQMDVVRAWIVEGALDD